MIDILRYIAGIIFIPIALFILMPLILGIYFYCSWWDKIRGRA